MKIAPDSTIQIAQDRMITVGKILKTYREKKGLALPEISAATKIPLVRLRQIENDEYGNFETQVFTRGFVKNYAEYLGLNVGKVLAIYRRSTVISRKDPSEIQIKRNQDPVKTDTIQNRFLKLIQRLKKMEITPTTIASGFGILLVILVTIYIVVQLYKFQQPPVLSIITPVTNVSTNKDTYEVSGITEVGSAVKVNNQPVTTNTSGEFKIEIKLNEGDNTITIKSYKNNNEKKAAVENRVITFKKDIDPLAIQTTPEVPITPILTKHTFQIEIVDEDAWITLILDDTQIIAWVLSPGKTETYEFTKTIEFTSGKPKTTSILIDGKQRDLIIGSGGVTNMKCSVENNDVKCE